MKPFKIIVAVDLGGGFTKDGKIPWHFPEDFKHFKEITMGNICVMGRLTYEDIASRRTLGEDEPLLPGRESYVVTTTTTYLPGVKKCIDELDEIDKYLDIDEPREIFVIGGEGLWREAIAVTDKIYMTVINDMYNCDKMFPVEYTIENFAVVQSYDVTGPCEKTDRPFIFIDWERTK